MSASGGKADMQVMLAATFAAELDT